MYSIKQYKKCNTGSGTHTDSLTDFVDRPLGRVKVNLERITPINDNNNHLPFQLKNKSKYTRTLCKSVKTLPFVEGTE